MILLIDNYDSFTYNVVNEFHRFEKEPVVLYNDDEKILDLANDPSLERVYISPGLSVPANAGLCKEFLQKLDKSIPTLGICLGHQLLESYAGIKIKIANKIRHGKTSK